MSNRRTFLKQGGAGIVGACGAREGRGNDRGARGPDDSSSGRSAAAAGARTWRPDVRTPERGRAGLRLRPRRGPARAAAKAVAKITGKAPKVVTDLRRVLDDKSVDAVTVATPDHWHAPATILACDAGKHVYVEKPCSHNIREGRLMVEAARRSNRVVQLGTQSRSNAVVAQAIEAAPRGR